MTITNRFHIRKLQLIMGAYRTRYAKRREKRAQGGVPSCIVIIVMWV